MAKMIFPYQVKYLNKYFQANTPFEAKDEDIKSLISDGGKLVEEKKTPVQDEKKAFKKRG